MSLGLYCNCLPKNTDFNSKMSVSYLFLRAHFGMEHDLPTDQNVYAEDVYGNPASDV